MELCGWGGIKLPTQVDNELFYSRGIFIRTMVQ